jgi:hypothetical protein
MKTYESDRNVIENGLNIIYHIMAYQENIYSFVHAGLLKTLVEIYNSSMKNLILFSAIVKERKRDMMKSL